LENRNLTSLAWPAPAKLNLFLHVTGQREDGYHLLQTVFQFIDLSDQLDFRILEHPQISLSSSYSGIETDQDLIIRAARNLQSETSCRLGAEITINKQIPMGGGLGGGSSDAATTLVALNQLWSLNLPNLQLQHIGVQLGADIPIFIHGHAAWAEGVGDRVTPVDPEEDWKLVLYPGCSVATAEIFRAGDLTRNTPAITIRDFLKAGGHNDCEGPARCRYPEISRALDWLAEFAPAQMTGTGSCVFASFSNRGDAEAVFERIPQNWQGYVTRAMNRSPLQDRLLREQEKP
jgi:4-diphosphocytidyl-2-C-methyl-D-erythritol kinase